MAHAAVHAAVMAACTAKSSCRVVSAVAAASVRAACGAISLPAVGSDDDDGLSARKEVAGAALQAHRDLHRVSQCKQPYMGLAFAAAKPRLPPDLAKALRRLQRLANSARHEWSDGPHDDHGSSPVTTDVGADVSSEVSDVNEYFGIALADGAAQTVPNDEVQVLLDKLRFMEDKCDALVASLLGAVEVASPPEPSDEKEIADALMLAAATTVSHIEQQMKHDPEALQPAYLSAMACLEQAAYNRPWARWPATSNMP